MYLTDLIGESILKQELNDELEEEERLNKQYKFDLEDERDRKLRKMERQKQELEDLINRK